MVTEKWRAVPGFDAYEVSDLGRVRSLDRTVVRSDGALCKRRGRMLTGSIGKNGYRTFTLYRGGAVKHPAYGHRLVLLAFAGQPMAGQEGCHIDGDRLNNRLQNLRWGTRSENARDRFGTRTDPRGEGSNTAKLRASDVIEIRGRLAAGEPQDYIAGLHGVSQSSISLIHLRKRWGHIA